MYWGNSSRCFESTTILRNVEEILDQGHRTVLEFKFYAISYSKRRLIESD
jgi:hypothetical protein